MASPALASVNTTLGWPELGGIELDPVLSGYYSSTRNLMRPEIPASVYPLVYADADGRVSDEFGIPKALAASFRFWLDIYTQYTTSHVVLFDERHPEVRYEAIDLRPILDSSRNRVVYEIRAKKAVASRMAAYREAFARLKKNGDAKGAFEDRIRAAAKSSPHAHGYAELEANFRSQLGQRDNLMKGLLAAEAFFPQMESLFRDVGVPVEITRLSLVESSFNPKAVSRAGAVGVWQFLLESGREYMTIDPKRSIDERISPLKSTAAAAQLLSRNRRILGSWLLAVTSFNHGLKTFVDLPKADRAKLSDGSFYQSCDPNRKARLGWASRNYYAEFLAVLYAESYRDLFFGAVPPVARQSIAFMQPRPGESALKFAIRTGVPLRAFQKLNPDIASLRARLPSGVLLAVPREADDFSTLGQTVIANSRRQKSGT